VLDPHAALATYVTVFQQIGWGAIVIGVVLGIASPFLARLAHEHLAPEADAAVPGAAPTGGA
jgi:dipeptide/tripeptide permease